MKIMLLFMGLGVPEIVIIFFAILLFFGGRKIPELMRGLGKGIREFNSAKATIEGEIKQGMKKDEEEKKKVEEGNS